MKRCSRLRVSRGLEPSRSYQSGPTVPRAEDLVVGAAISLTGGLAYADVPAQKGMQLAIDEINAAGGIGGKYKIESEA